MSEIARGVYFFASAKSKPSISECLKSDQGFLTNQKFALANFSVHDQEHALRLFLTKRLYTLLIKIN
jgi:hypothetical protein